MKRPIVPIVLALLLALAAGLAVFIYARSAEDRALQDQNPVTVLVNTDVIPLGMTLGDANSAGMITPQQVAQKLQPPGSLTEVNESNASLLALSAIPAGQILMSSDFGVGLPVTAPLVVPDGLLAVTVQIDVPAKVGSFLRPGSEIAVFDTVTPPPDADGKVPPITTRPLLDRALVLGIGDYNEQSAGAAPPEAWSATLVTLAVDQTQAEKLIHGTRTGALYMALLSDTTTLKPSNGVNDANLFD